MPHRSNFHSFTLACTVAGISAYTSSAHSQPCSPFEIDKLLASDQSAVDFFGHAVSVSGNTAVIGAPQNDDDGKNSGSVYIFRFDGNRWVEEAKLIADDGLPGDKFGSSVSISEGVVAIGAYESDELGNRSGSAYLFRYDGNNWMQETKLIPPDGGFREFFGFSVAIDGDVVVIGAMNDGDNGPGSGSAFVYRYNGINWIIETKLVPSDGEPSEHFGRSVAIDDSTILVGAFFDNDLGLLSGSAYIFEHDKSEWAQVSKLRAQDGSAFDNFGISVDISDDIAVVGSPLHENPEIDSGSAYVFQRTDNSQWTQVASLRPDTAQPNARFGGSVAISNSADLIVVGAHQDNHDAQFTGGVYLFRKDHNSWVQDAVIVAEDRLRLDYFGSAVSTNNTTIFVGTFRKDNAGPDSGSAYVFDLNCPPPCFPDVNNDGVVNPTDFDAWINAFNNQLPECDQNGDGSCTPTDFSAWIANYNAGC
jgi:hypothetical protein